MQIFFLLEKFKASILANPECKRGKKLSIEKVNAVIQFYEDDEFSHQMPGKKDCISTGNKQYKQKRLILSNLK